MRSLSTPSQKGSLVFSQVPALRFPGGADPVLADAA
jgi:hypothetical protein